MTIDPNLDSAITDAALERARAWLGREIPIAHPFNTEAQRDTIRHWTDGIGDTNPLWTDEKYAAQTRWGGLLAPPTFLYTCNQGPAHRGAGTGFRGMPGVHRFWVKEAWEWFLPIRVGDQIRAVYRLVDLVEHRSSFAGRSVEDITEQKFWNQDGGLIAVHRMHFISAERRTTAERGKHRDFRPHRYTQEELDRIWQDVQREARRGAEPRYWEDVQVGEEVPHVVKGPYTSTEAVAFVMGWGGPFVMASEVTHRYLHAHPRANVPDRETNAPDFPERAHWDIAFAREVGAPAAYDFGGQRVSWIVHALTNWAGDDGFVRSIEAKLVKFNVTGDTTWCRGKVTGKATEHGEPLVRLEVWGENQRGEVTVTGEARVRLPVRG